MPDGKTLLHCSFLIRHYVKFLLFCIHDQTSNRIVGCITLVMDAVELKLLSCLIVNLRLISGYLRTLARLNVPSVASFVLISIFSTKDDKLVWTQESQQKIPSKIMHCFLCWIDQFPIELFCFSINNSSCVQALNTGSPIFIKHVNIVSDSARTMTIAPLFTRNLKPFVPFRVITFRRLTYRR